MKSLKRYLLVFLLGLPWFCPANADIYVWTDENGVKHITNYAPPERAQVLIRTPEIPYDAEADRQRQEAERRERMAREKLELEEKEARLERLEREASARLAAAEQLHLEMRAYQKGREDQARDQDANRRSFRYGGPLWYGGWGRFPGYGRNGYYRKDGSIYYKQRRPHHPDQLKSHHQRKLKNHSERAGKHPSKRSDDSSLGVRAPHPSARQPARGPHAYHRRY